MRLTPPGNRVGGGVGWGLENTPPSLLSSRSPSSSSLLTEKLMRRNLMWKTLKVNKEASALEMESWNSVFDYWVNPDRADLHQHWTKNFSIEELSRLLMTRNYRYNGSTNDGYMTG